MNASVAIRSTLLLICLALCPGCGWFGEEDAEEAAATVEAEAETPAPAAVDPQPTARLQLDLKPQDRFPLLKTVTQRLEQNLPAGVSVSESELSLLMAITVEQVTADGRTLLRVDYDKVRYRQDFGGQQLVYDSTNPPDVVPTEALPYQGLVGNGFAFWLKPDNSIGEVVGFDDFLQRCVRDVAPAQRQSVLSAIKSFSGGGTDGIANFVDDSVGLLPVAGSSETGSDPAANPSNGEVAVGSQWIQERRFLQPIPIYLRNTCTVRNLDERTAEIDIAGSMVGTTSFFQPEGPDSQMKLSVRGGRAFGTCVIRRDTGLPVNTRIERILDMDVQPVGGDGFTQRKHLVTTIRAFPEQPAARQVAPAHYSQQPGRGNAIQQTGGYSESYPRGSR